MESTLAGIRRRFAASACAATLVLATATSAPAPH